MRRTRTAFSGISKVGAPTFTAGITLGGVYVVRRVNGMQMSTTSALCGPPPTHGDHVSVYARANFAGKTAAFRFVIKWSRLVDDIQYKSIWSIRAVMYCICTCMVCRHTRRKHGRNVWSLRLAVRSTQQVEILFVQRSLCLHAFVSSTYPTSLKPHSPFNSTDIDLSVLRQ